jgi:hypothetical protein
MKQFAITFAAVFVAAALALLGYDHLIVKPREATQAEALLVNLSTAEQQAQGIADDLDAAITQSVNNANETMHMQANEMKQRSLAVDALVRASMFKTALTEYFMSNGQWPKTQTEAGLAKPDSYAGGAVGSITVADQGVVVITLNSQIDSGAKIKLVPDANLQSYVINWRCSTEGSETLGRLLPDCK